MPTWMILEGVNGIDSSKLPYLLDHLLNINQKSYIKFRIIYANKVCFMLLVIGNPLCQSL